MLNNLFKKIFSFTIAVLVFFSLSAMANDSNWTETFALKNGSWAIHSPNYVEFDGFRSKHNLIIGGGSMVNNTRIGLCGLYLSTESTREKFVSALTCAGLYPA